MSEELTVSAAAPVVDTKKTTSGATFTSEILEKIPTARDPWQIINMTPGVQAGLNVGGSSSGQQVGLASRGTNANVQWNLEGGSITDLSSNSSPSYFNFDSFDQISVVNGGGDVSVQSSGLSINLVTKSGSNVFKGSAVGTFQNDQMQGNNVTREQFALGTSGSHGRRRRRRRRRRQRRRRCRSQAVAQDRALHAHAHLTVGRRRRSRRRARSRTPFGLARTSANSAVARALSRPPTDALARDGERCRRCSAAGCCTAWRRRFLL
jgi:hypothetical protein